MPRDCSFTEPGRAFLGTYLQVKGWQLFQVLFQKTPRKANLF